MFQLNLRGGIYGSGINVGYVPVADLFSQKWWNEKPCTNMNETLDINMNLCEQSRFLQRRWISLKKCEKTHDSKDRKAIGVERQNRSRHMEDFSYSLDRKYGWYVQQHELVVVLHYSSNGCLLFYVRPEISVSTRDRRSDFLHKFFFLFILAYKSCVQKDRFLMVCLSLSV